MPPTLHGSKHCLFVLALHAKDLTYGALKLIAEPIPQAQCLKGALCFHAGMGAWASQPCASLRTR